MLCSNRFEPAGRPSTCTLDSAIIPLPSFLFTAAVVFKFALYIVQRKKRDQRQQSQRHAKWLMIFYVFLTVAAFAINGLQIARLAHDQQGVGLLPITLVGLFLVLFLVREPHPPYLFLPYWMLWTAFEALNVARLHKLNQLHPAKGSLYPSSDRLLDNIVLLAMYVVLLLTEVGLLYRARHHEARLASMDESERDGSLTNLPVIR